MPGESLDSVNIPVIFDYANNFMRNIERLKLDGKIMFDYDQSEIGISEFFELAEIVKQGVNKCETVTNKDRRKNAKLFCWQKETPEQSRSGVDIKLGELSKVLFIILF